MEVKLIICFSCVIPTMNFQQLKILLVTLLFFIVQYMFLKQFVKLLMVKYTYLTAPFLEPLSFWVYSQRQILHNSSSNLSWTQGILLNFLTMQKILRSLAEEYLLALSLCCPYIFDSYITCLTLRLQLVKSLVIIIYFFETMMCDAVIINYYIVTV